RAPSAPQRASRRNEPRRPASRAARFRGSLRGVRPPLRPTAAGQIRDHRLGPGQRASGQDLDLGSRRVGQLLHRELVVLARPQDHALDLPCTYHVVQKRRIVMAPTKGGTPVLKRLSAGLAVVGVFLAFGVSAGFSATPRQVYLDLADNGRLDHHYTTS